MPTLRKKQWSSLAVPVSYRINEQRNRLFDAKNVYPNQDRLSTRYGIRRYNTTSLGGEILSSSFFKDASSNRKLLAKVDTVIYSVAASGAHTSIKTGLTSTTKHRGISGINRHLIACESDGLFQWDGTTFTQLGQAPGSAPTNATQGSGLTNSTYTTCYTFYSSTTGFESNASADSATISTVSQGIRVTMPTTAANATIDYKRIYLRDVTADSERLFVAEVALATSTYDIASNPTSTVTPPTTNAAPISGGGKYLTMFGRALAYTGNSTYPSDVFISEDDLPDAFDDSETSKTFAMPGDGPNTGIACGLFNDSILDPFLVVFKRTKTGIYCNRDGTPTFTILNENIGCVSDRTIHVKNGAVYFLSVNGWRVIVNGKLATDENGNPVTLGRGDVDDIFRSPGYSHEVNASQLSNCHSFYYEKTDQYATFVAEGASTDFTRAYAYSFDLDGFFPMEVNTSIKTSVNGEDSSGNECIFLGDTTGTFFTYSSENDKTDNDKDGNEVNIDAFALMAWFQADGDMEKSYSFIRLHLKALANDESISAYTWLNYVLGDQVNFTYDFPSPNSGFILDESILDEGVFSDGRDIVYASKYIKRTGRNILLGFYQSAANVSMELIAAQLEFVANGNSN